ncbi:hypothetical protein DFH11DRAFT_1605216, partial [Phellopilus nigrolimitatus]
MAARRLQAISRSGAAGSEQAKEERRLREEQVKKEEERRQAKDLTGAAERAVRANGRAGKAEAKPDEVETIDPAPWSNLVYNYGGNSNPSATAGVISSCRPPHRPSHSFPRLWPQVHRRCAGRPLLTRATRTSRWTSLCRIRNQLWCPCLRRFRISTLPTSTAPAIVV